MPKRPSPNPDWKPKDKIAPPKDSPVVSIDPTNISVSDVYKIIVGTIVPRPIAFVSTQSKEGKRNLAPFSSYNLVSSNPPALLFSIVARQDGSIKDTLRNILDTREFVVNSANQWLIEPLVYSAGEFPADVNEMEEVGLTPIASEVVKPPRVKESAVHFECSLYSHMKVGDGSVGSSTVVVGKIERIHLASHLYKDGKIILSDLQPVGRLGGASYTNLSHEFDLKIPDLTR